MSDDLDRARGALLGLAVGDALGAPLEFAERDECPLVTNMISGGPFNLKPGEWTDDTAMALCLADSLIAQKGLDTQDLMRRFVRWWRHGENSVTGHCFDIGMTTARALQRFETTGEIILDANPQTAGNGSLMRMAPVAIFASSDTELAIDLARQQSAGTHGAPLCLDACALFAELLSNALQGGDKRKILGRRPIFDDVDERLAEIALGSYRIKKRHEIRSGGFVLDTLEAALWAIWHSESFEEALIAAVNLAGDSDTVGAVTGQLAGAIWGASAIPERWVEQLAWREEIERRADQLIAAGCSASGKA
ncbi:MAG: ADP-ribosyl-[dinitrogen reductase] hydrolase [Rhodospirillales bacterium 20-64-7]|nr:MAG: ADP-ribosyl-[dinitrogen reductase] hydrolase [Rhodospirillales bacterium 20-64-7]